MEEKLVDDPSVTLTIRLIMQGKEVGSIIGKKGEIVKRFREESGAKINISDGSCPERIVTVSGSTRAIFKAFSLITKKFEEWCSQFNDVNAPGGKTQIPIRLIVPASQCGSLIGKGGSKIKEIREVTGCSIQVASEMLPNSTERAVTLNGTAEQITQCIYHICCVMLESPPKGTTIPYRPKPQVNGPVILANGQAYTIQGNFAVPAQETCTVFPLTLAGGLHAAGISGLADPLLKGAHLTGAVPPHHLQQMPDMSGLTKNPLAGLAAVGLAGMAPTNTGGLNPVALAALAGSQLRTNNTTRTQQTNQQQHEMTVPNDLIGCIIGKGGTKIAEIRQISGAMIRISNCEEREGGNTDRTITISGNPDAVAVAQYLINMSVELQKANLSEGNNNQSSSSSSTSSTSLTSTNATSVSATVSSNGSGVNGGGGLSGAVTALGLANGGAGPQQSSVVSQAQQQSPPHHQSLTQSNSNSTNVTNSSVTNATSNVANANSSPPTPAALASAIPLAQLLAKPGALNALNSITALSGLTDFLGGLVNLGGGPPVQTTGVHRSGKWVALRYRSSEGGSSISSNNSTSQTNNGNSGGSEKKSDRNKFNPY